MACDVRPDCVQVDWSSMFCACCHDTGGALIMCDGTCLRSFHEHCLPPPERPAPDSGPDDLWYCAHCNAGRGECTVCGAEGDVGSELLKCRMGSCGLYYHRDCLLELGEHLHYKLGSERYDAGHAAARHFACCDGPWSLHVAMLPCCLSRMPVGEQHVSIALLAAC